MFNKAINLSRPRSLVHFLNRSLWIAISNVVTNGVVKEHRILGNNANRLSEAGLLHIQDILTVNQDLSRLNIVEAK